MQILQRKIDPVRGWIDRHHVRVRTEPGLAEQVQRPVLQRERRHNAAFARHVQPLQRGVEGQHVGITAYRERSDHAAAGQVEHQQAGVVLAGDEGQPLRRHQQQAVIAAGAGQVDARDHLVGGRIDLGQLRARHPQYGRRSAGKRSRAPKARRTSRDSGLTA